MAAIWISLEAQEDIDDIHGYIAARGTPLRALHVIGNILKCVERLREFPESGRIRCDVDDGVRTIGWGPYLAFYRVSDDRGIVEVIRVIDGRRDLPTAFSEVSYLVAA